MCFLPKSRASIDLTPGPIIAEVAPKVLTATAESFCAAGRLKATLDFTSSLWPMIEAGAAFFLIQRHLQPSDAGERRSGTVVLR
jgi:hypothetical protein